MFFVLLFYCKMYGIDADTSLQRHNFFGLFPLLDPAKSVFFLFHLPVPPSFKSSSSFSSLSQ